MLHGLDRLLATIEGGTLDEAALYRQERLYRGPARRAGAPGVLECPICGQRAARFLRFGLAGRRNAQCPGCGSVERHRMLWLYLGQHTDLLRARHRVLHTAPESCFEARLRARPNLRYRSVDRYNPAADVQADLIDLPFADGDFDVLLTSHVLEHIRDDRAAMAELARVVQPGGWAVVMVPYDPRRPRTEEGADIDDPAERMARFGHPFHFRIYGADLSARLAEVGFDATVIDSRRLFSPHRRRRFRINRNYLLRCRRVG
ncbi:MAG: class I SAM-dependent methyltransferase [Inquilinus sp.]|nr:class I SAM-dependent methyltransferase [Inquilinus sp.]